MTEKLYYVEDSRYPVGNCISWWAKDGAGYTCHLDKAHIFTADEIRRRGATRTTDVPWPKEVVDQAASLQVDLKHFRGDDLKKFSTDFAQELFHLKSENRTPLHLFLEEARKFIPQKLASKLDTQMIGAFEDIVRLGRNYGLGASLLDQRPQSVNKEVLSQTELLIVHQLTAKLERKAIEDWVHDKAKDGEDSLDQLHALQPGECFFWSPGLMRVFAKVKVGKKSTYDSSATPEIGDESNVAPMHLSAGDMSNLKKAMSSIVEEIEAKDPTKLQQELQKSKAQEAALTKRISSLEEQLKSARLLESAAEVVKEVSVLTESDLAQIRAEAEAMVSAAGRVKGILEEMAKEVASHQSAARKTAALRPARTATLAPAPRNSIQDQPPGNIDLSGPEQRILNALAWLEGIGVERPETNAVAFLAGYKPGGGAFNNPKGSLRSRGLIEYAPGKRVSLTDAGRVHAQSPDAPLDTSELHRQALERLGGPETRILTPLLEAWPGSLSNAELADAAGYGAGGGAFNNPRGRLRTLGLLDYPEPGQVRACDLLFL